MRFRFQKEFSLNPDFRASPLAHEVPLATVDHDVYVMTDGSMAAVFRVHGTEYDLAQTRDTHDFCVGLRSVLNVLPTGVQLKVLYRVTHNYRKLLDEHRGELNGKNPFARYVAWDQYRNFVRMMEQNQLLRSETLVVLTYHPKIAWHEQDDKVKALLDSVAGAGSGKAQRSVATFRLALLKFEAAIRQVVEQMRFSGLGPERLDTPQLYDLAWEILNPRESLRRPCPAIRRVAPNDPYATLFGDVRLKKAAKKRPELTVVAPLTEREQLCASNWLVGDKWVRMDDVYVGAVYLRMLPTHVYPTMALALSALPFECTVSLDAVMLAKQKELEQQWARTRSDESKASATLMGGTPDPMRAEEANEQRQRYMQLASSAENPLRFRVVVTVTAPDPRTLNERCEAIVATFRNMENGYALREQYDGVPTLIKTTWPFAPITDVSSRKALTSQAANLLPLFSRWEGSRRPVTLFLDQMQRLVRHDPFPSNQLNRNRTLTGKSGSGKSFSCQLADVQPHAARDKTEILIVESGGSFELTTKCFGGTYLLLGPSCPYQINPFDLPPGFESLPAEKQEEELRYKYGFIKNLVMAMARLVDPESQMLAENVVGTVCQRTYALSKTPRFRDFYRVLGEYRNKEDDRAEKLAGRLRTLLANYVVSETGEPGIYAKYFDCHTTMDVETPILCFDLMAVKNDPALLTPMTLVTLGGLIYNRLMRRDGCERLVIVDEAWALIKEGPNGEQSPAGAMVELFWREGRKLGASSTMISQNYSDMAQDKVGRAVVANSPIQYFLVHERLKANDDAFRSANFSTEKMDRLYGLRTVYGQYSEIMVKEGEEWGIVRLPSAGLKYWLATTDPKDLNIRHRYFKKYGEGYKLPDHVVVVLLAQDYPGGYHAPHGEEMSDQDALQFAERWQEHYRRFCERVTRGEDVPHDFR